MSELGNNVQVLSEYLRASGTVASILAAFVEGRQGTCGVIPEQAEDYIEEYPYSLAGKLESKSAENYTKLYDKLVKSRADYLFIHDPASEYAENAHYNFPHITAISREGEVFACVSLSHLSSKAAADLFCAVGSWRLWGMALESGKDFTIDPESLKRRVKLVFAEVFDGEGFLV